MRPGKFSYNVMLKVTFSSEDVKTLVRCTMRHYDVKCQKLSQPGGLLHNLLSVLKSTENKTVAESLDFSTLDLLAKATENGQTIEEKEAHADLIALLGIVQRETLHINGVD